MTSYVWISLKIEVGIENWKKLEKYGSRSSLIEWKSVLNLNFNREFSLYLDQRSK